MNVDWNDRLAEAKAKEQAARETLAEHALRWSHGSLQGDLDDVAYAEGAVTVWEVMAREAAKGASATDLHLHLTSTLIDEPGIAPGDEHRARGRGNAARTVLMTILLRDLPDPTQEG